MAMHVNSVHTEIKKVPNVLYCKVHNYHCREQLLLWECNYLVNAVFLTSTGIIKTINKNKSFAPNYTYTEKKLCASAKDFIFLFFFIKIELLWFNDNRNISYFCNANGRGLWLSLIILPLQ